MAEDDKELNVLFVDDEVDNLSAFTFNCEAFWATQTLTGPEDVMNGTHEVDNYDAVIVDLVFGTPQTGKPNPKIDPRGGLSLLDWFQAKHPKIPVMVLSAYLTDDLRATIRAKYPKVLCKEKPLDFSKAAFREMIQTYITDYRSSGT